MPLWRPQVSGFTQQQYLELAASFEEADRHKRGQLDALELTEVLRRAGFHVSTQERGLRVAG